MQKKYLIDAATSEDLIPTSIKESIIKEKLNILKDKDTFSSTVKDFISNTETNIYYIGSMDFLSKEENTKILVNTSHYQKM